MRVLLVEDEMDFAAAIARQLEREGLAVDVSHDGRDALERAPFGPYDVILLDRDLPIVSGDEVCARLKAMDPSCKILMLTAADHTDDVVEGFSLGTDDYVKKPVDAAELIVRIKALSRRIDNSLPPVLERGDLTLDSARGIASRGDRRLQLSPKEFQLLEVLMRANGAVVSNDELLRQVWDEDVSSFSSIARVTVLGLRRKKGEPAAVETVSGQGYRIP